MGIEAIIGVIFLAAGLFGTFITTLLKSNKPETPSGRIESHSPGRTPIEVVGIKDYQTLTCNIPALGLPIISRNIDVRIMGFQKLDPENPSHKSWIKYHHDLVFKAIEDATIEKKPVEMGQYLRGNGFFLRARVFVGGVDLESLLEYVPKNLADDIPAPAQIEHRRERPAINYGRMAN